MEFRFLGTLEVTAGGQRLALGGPRQQIALAMLLLDANHPVTMARLTEAIYEENIPSTSRAQVQICISALRRLFATFEQSAVIATVPPGYAIQIPPSSIDFHRFTDRVHAARTARQAGRLDEAVQHYRSGLAEWRGPAFDGVDSRLVQTAASRLTEQWVTAREDCCQLELDLGRHHELVGELTALVAEHPLRERLLGQLMLALYRSDRQAEALRVFRQARDAMQDELGIEPNERLQQLQRAILTADESLHLPAVVPTGRAAPQPGNPPTAETATGTGSPGLAAGTARTTTPPPDPADEGLSGASGSAGPQGGRPTSGAGPSGQPTGVNPRMLPTDIDDFTGRTKQIDSIRQQLLIAFGDSNRHAVPVIVLAGKPGIGKTATVVHTSHAISELFPDGQLFADLHGGTANPVSPMQVLERFLRALGVAGAPLADGLEERAEMYRGLLAGRRMLVVLDDAASEHQILSLLPGNATSAVLITSRSRLAGLAGAIHVDVDLFEPDQSVELLARIAGRERVEAEPEATLELAQLCGQLPLALRIAGARLSARPHWSVEQLVMRLEDETHRLDELKHGAMGIRASISFAYESSTPDARRLFRRLAILDTRTFSGWVSAALLDLPLTEALDLLDDLADAQLIETTGPGRGVHSQYRFHDLIRVFARERLAVEESATERSAALRRVLGALLFMMEQAHRRAYGGDYVQIHGGATRWPLPPRLVERLIREPLLWYERERLTLVAGIRQAADAGFAELCWDLAISAVTLFESRMYLDDWRETHEIALAAARRASDTRGTAAVLYSIGSLRITQQRFDDARRDFEQAVELFTEVGDRLGTALTVRNIAFLDRMSGAADRAAAGYEQALAVFRSTGDQVAAAYVLHNLAQLRLDADQLDQAGQLLDEALDLSRRGGSRRVQAQVLHRTGETWLRRGEPGRAAEAFGEALLVARENGDRAGEAYILHGLGMAHLAGGRLTDADVALREAARLAVEAGERLVHARAVFGLAELALAAGTPTEAVRQGKAALGLFRSIVVPLQEARVWGVLAEAYAALGDQPGAVAATDAALALVATLDAPLAERERARLGATTVRDRPAG